jgi:hypothetical protein
MKFENLEIRTNPFKKSPPRKKDGLHQLKIRTFIGSNDHFGKHFLHHYESRINFNSDSFM